MCNVYQHVYITDQRPDQRLPPGLWNQGYLCILMSFCEGGDLATQALRRYRRTPRMVEQYGVCSGARVVLNRIRLLWDTCGDFQKSGAATLDPNSKYPCHKDCQKRGPVFWKPPGYFRGPKDHINIRISHSGSRAHYRGDARNDSLVGFLCLYTMNYIPHTSNITFILYHIFYTIFYTLYLIPSFFYHIRALICSCGLWES